MICFLLELRHTICIFGKLLYEPRSITYITAVMKITAESNIPPPNPMIIDHLQYSLAVCALLRIMLFIKISGTEKRNTAIPILLNPPVLSLGTVSSVILPVRQLIKLMKNMRADPPYIPIMVHFLFLHYRCIKIPFWIPQFCSKITSISTNRQGWMPEVDILRLTGSWNGGSLTRDQDQIGSPSFLSFPEFKRFSSFPDGFIFAGDFTDGIRQVGNCVPPLFMKAIAEYVRCNLLGGVSWLDAAISFRIFQFLVKSIICPSDRVVSYIGLRES